MILAALIFSILLALKLEDLLSISWWTVFVPLFACDALVAYFDAIVFIRMYLDGELEVALKRVILNGCVLLLLSIYKILLCQKLTGKNDLQYSVIHTPIFILMFGLIIRSTCGMPEK